LIVIPIWIALSFPGSKKDKHLPIFWAIQTIPEMLLAGVVFRQQLLRIQGAVVGLLGCIRKRQIPLLRPCRIWSLDEPIESAFSLRRLEFGQP
jgi:hypothetical protein